MNVTNLETTYTNNSGYDINAFTFFSVSIHVRKTLSDGTLCLMAKPNGYIRRVKQLEVLGLLDRTVILIS